MHKYSLHVILDKSGVYVVIARNEQQIDYCLSCDWRCQWAADWLLIIMWLEVPLGNEQQIDYCLSCDWRCQWTADWLLLIMWLEVPLGNEQQIDYCLSCDWRCLSAMSCRLTIAYHVIGGASRQWAADWLLIIMWLEVPLGNELQIDYCLSCDWRCLSPTGFMFWWVTFVTRYTCILWLDAHRHSTSLIMQHKGDIARRDASSVDNQKRERQNSVTEMRWDTATIR